MKQQILINELNKEEYKSLDILMNDYLDGVEQLKLLEERLKKQKELLETYRYDTIGVQDRNVRVAITPSKIIKKINYEATLEGQDLQHYKMVKTTYVWDDKLIEEDLKDKVIYEEVKKDAIIRISSLNKEIENE